MAFNLKKSIIRSRVTEKATVVGGQNIFVFDVQRDSTKSSIAHDIKSIYKVTPMKIAIVNTPAKKITMKGKIGQTRAPKKAYVYLKKGDTINIT